MKLNKIKAIAVIVPTMTIGMISSASAVGGISGAKLSAPNTATVEKGHLEFEPYFGVAVSSQDFDQRWRNVGSGYRHQNYETGFRFTAGIAKTLEGGLILPILFHRTRVNATDEQLSSNGIGDMPVGLKWRFFERKRVSLALAVGVVFPTGHHETDGDEPALGEGNYVPGLGFIATFELYKKLSLDVHVGYETAIHPDDGVTSMGAVFDLALGYTIGPIQPVIELSQSVSGWDSVLSYELALLAGLTWDLSKKLIVVTGARVPLTGKNASREFGFSLAFTILL